MKKYLVQIDLYSASGQLLRAADFHYETKKEAIKNSQKIFWLLGCASSEFLVSGYCSDVKIYLLDQNKYIEFTFKDYF